MAFLALWRRAVSLLKRSAWCLAVCVVSAALAGCVNFTRTVVNGHVRAMDSSWIEPGRTTRDDVIARWGRPPAIIGIKDIDRLESRQDGLARHFAECLTLWPKGIDSKGEDVDSCAHEVFRWYCVDSFNGSFEGGKWIVPTFAKGRSYRAHDILVLFDRNGIVSLLGRAEIVDGEVHVLEWKEAR